MELNVLLVEDSLDDLKQVERLIPEVLDKYDLTASIDSKNNFEDGYKAIMNPHSRYDLIVSDTYRGATTNGDVAVQEMIEEYKKGKFCPIVVYSSGTQPPTIVSSVFVNWADKATSGDIERAVGEVLDLGIPQMAKTLHDELDKAAGSYLWEFLEKEWNDLSPNTSKEQLERIIRRRAALAISDLMPGSDKYVLVPNRYGLEYYIYPSLEQGYYSLGDVIRCKSNDDDIRVILTPHCHLFKQPNAEKPRADYVLTAKTLPVEDVLGEKLNNAKDLSPDKKTKKLKVWARSPAQTEKHPDGRHWYLPKFLRIPHLFVDFLQIESIEYDVLESDYDRMATLAPPYSEALQTCFSSFYASVGIPDIAPQSILDLLE